MDLKEAMEYAHKMGFPFKFDWDSNRSSEGFYNIEGSPELCAARTSEYLKYADMAWMETASPDLGIAGKFA
jgi:isocitrate lyase